MANVVRIAKEAAELLEKLAPWAAKEAEEIAAKAGVPIQQAIEDVADKYGQRAYKKIAPPVFTPEEKSILSSEKGKRVYYPPQEGPLPRKGDDRSLTEIQGEQRARALPGVFESMEAREASKFQDPAVRLDERLRQQSADQKGRIRSKVDESATAREASRYSEPVPPKQPSKSDTSASEDYEASFGELDTGIRTDVQVPTLAKALAVGAGVAAATGADIPDFSFDDVDTSQIIYDDGKMEYQQTLTPSFKDTPEAESDSTKALKGASTSAIKKEVGKSLSVLDLAVEEAKKQEQQKQIPESEVDKFRVQRDKAYEMYEQAKTRNEWMEVASILARAAAQYGAARYGQRTGQDMSGIALTGPDYAARTEGERRLLETRLRDIGTEQELEAKAKEKEEQAKEKKAAADFKEKEFELAKQKAKDSKAYDDAMLQIKRQEVLNDALKRQGAITYEEKEQRKLFTDNLKTALKTANEQYKKALQVSNTIAELDDFSPSSLRELDKKAPNLLADAGIGIAQLQAIQDRATEYTQIAGYKVWSKLDKTKRNKIIQQEIVNEKKTIMDGIKAQLDALAGGRAATSAPSTETQTEKKTRAPGSAYDDYVPPAGSTPPEGKKDPKISDYAKQYNLEYDKAKEILTNRGYTPREE